MKKYELSCAPRDGAETEIFSIFVPETSAEFVGTWGGNPMDLIFVRTSVTVQAQAAYRVLRLGKRKLTAHQAAKEMEGWQPNTTLDSRRGLTRMERLMRDARKAGFSDDEIRKLSAAVDHTKKEKPDKE